MRVTIYLHYLKTFEILRMGDTTHGYTNQRIDAPGIYRGISNQRLRRPF